MIVKRNAHTRRRPDLGSFRGKFDSPSKTLYGSFIDIFKKL